VLTPDVAARLPGRGVWVKSDRASVETALKRKAFARSLGAPADPGQDLPGAIEAALRRAALSRLSLARRGGALTAGFDQVRAEIRRARPACLVEASDAAEDGQGKLLALWRAAYGDPVTVRLFGSEALGAAIGRERAVHLCLAPGGLADGFLRDCARLEGFL